MLATRDQGLATIQVWRGLRAFGQHGFCLAGARLGESGKVNIACDPIFPGHAQQGQQISTFSLTAAAADEDDQAGIGMSGHQREEIVPVASHDHKPVCVGIVESIQVTNRHWQRVAQFRHFMSFATQYPRHFRGNVMIEEKPHDLSGPLIWRATSVSISARWSS